MNFGTTNAAVLTGALVMIGQWAEDREIHLRVVVGTVFLIVMLAVLSEVNDDLARSFALLILISVALRYGVPVLTRLGLVQK